MDDRLGPTGPAPTKAESVQPEDLPSCPTEEPAPDADSLTDHAERLQADRELRDTLAAHSFAGPAYAVFEEELASYGYQVMMALLATGHIFIRCRQAGMNLPALPIPIADREDLAQETVAQTLPAFKRKALQQGGWRPEGGASLKTFFTGALYRQFANIWRKRLRTPAASMRLPLESLLSDTESPDPGPADTCLQQDEIRRGLADIKNPKTRVALVLTEDGYEQEEIAEILGPDVTPRGVEGYLRRHRAQITRQADEGGKRR